MNYPDLQGYFNTAFAGDQAVVGTTRPLPDLTRHIPVAYSVIEETVEGFVESFFTSCNRLQAHFLLGLPFIRVAG
jgi:hypothetical protein